MPVSSQHEQYIKYAPQWRVCRDSVEGESAVKSRAGRGGWAGSAYIPVPNPSDVSDENRERYRAYVERSCFLPATPHTKEGLMGMAFREEIHIDMPAAMDDFLESADGAGQTLEQLTRDVFGDALETGRYGLLVDYPQVEEGATAADTDGLRPYISRYPAESILNWREESVGGAKLLVMVVLLETVERIDPEDPFEPVVEDAYRVLAMVEGAYTHLMYDKDGEFIAEMTPRMADGAPWREIPFAFIGAQNNDPSVDKPPLYDLATINIAHLRNSSDQEEASFMVGQPTPVISGLSRDWAENVLGGEVQLGSRAPWVLPEGGGANLLQANPNQMPGAGMEAKERQMVNIGARLIQSDTSNVSATASKIKYAGQNSKLSVLAGNVEEAITRCSEWAMEFMGVDGADQIELRLTRDYYQIELDPQMIIAQIQLLDRGVVAVNDVRDNLKSAGVLSRDRDDETIEIEVESESPIEGA